MNKENMQKTNRQIFEEIEKLKQEFKKFKDKRIRKVKKIGNSWFIKLEPADIKDWELKEGSDMIILKNE